MHKAWKPARGNGNRTTVLQIDGQAVLRNLRRHDSIARMYDTAPISVLLAFSIGFRDFFASTLRPRQLRG